MNIEITNKTKEPLLKRTAFQAKAIFEGKTPSRIEMKKDLATKLESKDDAVIIKKIATNYGSATAVITGYYYEQKEFMDKIEPRHAKMRHLTKADRLAEKEKIKAAKIAATPTVAKKKK